MAVLLLLVIYVCFIGLGIPDSIFGSCWPALKVDLGLPVSYANYVTTIITVFTMLSTLFSAKLINKLGTGWVTVVSTLSTAIALLGFSYSNSFLFLLLLAIPLGFGAGAIDSALNNYVAIHYKASQMSFLHSFYGVGVFLSPIIMSYALEKLTWRNGYKIVAIIQFIIFFIALVTLPLWKKETKDEPLEVIKNNNIKEVLKIKPMRVGLFVFMFACAVEFLCGLWGTTYLVGVRNLSPSLSALSLGVYYLGMTLGRFTSGLLNKKLNGFQIIFGGQAFVIVGILLVLFKLPYYYGMIGLFLIGFGNGPVFPNMTHLTPILYGKENSQSIISLQMVSCYGGVTVIPFIFGYLAKDYLHIFPYALLLFYLLCIFCLITLTKMLKKYKKQQNRVDNVEQKE